MTKEIIETHDFSALDAITNSKTAHSRAKLLVAAGIGGLMFGLGGAALLWGYSLVREPKIITTEKVVVTEKLVTVEVPKIIEKEKVVQVDRPVITEKIERVEVPTPQPPAQPQETPLQSTPVTPNYMPQAQLPPPTVGTPMAAKEMEARPDYQSANTHGRILGIEHGVIRLDTGNPLTQVDASLNKVDWTTNKLNGLPTYCRDNGRFNPKNNTQLMDCFVTYHGKVQTLEAIAKADTANATAEFDPFGDLFN